MKTIKEIIKQEPVFLNDWGGQDVYQLMSDFRIGEAELLGKKILFASYTYENYSGNAFVLVAVGEELFAVYGGHCSCYGLEGQFSLEHINLQALETALTKGSVGLNEYKGELIKFLGIS